MIALIESGISGKILEQNITQSIRKYLENDKINAVALMVLSKLDHIKPV